MLYYDRIEVSERIYINKTIVSKQCDIYHYWYFLDKGFMFQLNICSGCHDIPIMSMNLNNIAVLNINCIDYPCIITRISRSEVINLMQNIDLREKCRTL